MVGMWGMTSDLYHLREVTSIGQLQNYVKFIVLDEGVQVLYHVRVVQLLQVTRERERQKERQKEREGRIYMDSALNSNSLFSLLI